MAGKNNKWEDVPDGEYATPEDEERGGRMLEIIEGLEDFASADLEMLIGHAEDALKKARDREAKQAMAELEAVAKKFGFDIDELVRRKAEELVSGQTGEPIRFQHPKNKALTWTGRGRLPKWLKDAQEAGEDIEDYRIRA